MNGNVVHANVQLTYNNSGFWEAPEKMDASQLTGAQFYAYYPYSATAQFDASSSTPFAAMVNAVQPAHNQSAKADYEAADIMVSTACAIGQYNAVSLPLKHQKALHHAPTHAITLDIHTQVVNLLTSPYFAKDAGN